MRKSVVAVGLFLALLLGIPIASEVAVTNYRRWQASKLLKVVHQLTPGVSTEAYTRAILKSFAPYDYSSEGMRNGLQVGELEYRFYNETEWMAALARNSTNLSVPTTPPWTLFSVDFTFVQGTLAEIHVVEMQEDHPGYPHPNAASVSILSTRFGALPRSPYGPLPGGFNGYSEHPQSTGALDKDGNLTSFTCCHERFITLDERASPAQLSNSLNFQLHCMTSFRRCKDDRQILP